LTGLEPFELEQLRLTVGEELGFAFEGERLEQLGHAARARQSELGLSGVDAYMERLRAPSSSEEVAKLAELLTVTETFFYRSADQIRALIEAVLPERARAAPRRLRILSAGCASGEEPYSLAIALREALPDVDAWDLKIVGIDVNPAMLTKARRAHYTPWSLRATPDTIRARYFRASGSEFALDESVTRMVTFRPFNLASADPIFYRALACDAIFCRNVLMYFTPEVMRSAVMRLTEALAPGGFLFLGHAETLRGLSHEYHLCHTHNTFYYQHRDGNERAPRLERTVSTPVVELAREFLPAESGGSWFEAIQSASHRVAELTSPSSRDSTRPRNGTVRPPSRRVPHAALAPLLGLMQEERFAEARALLDALPADAGKHPDALLFSAVLFTNDGNLAQAERACESLLAADELNAGAHYLKALCREHAGDDAGAAEHDRIAAHLDPTFAMPHLHAGLLAKRSGDALVARRELGQAFLLLEREDAPRLVLFGGGFSRDTLTALCRAELARLGVAR
jgi:chemotaxis protein methyltransferase CheR